MNVAWLDGPGDGNRPAESNDPHNRILSVDQGGCEREVTRISTTSRYAQIVGPVAVGAALLMLGGCAGLFARAPEEIVKGRAEAYWKARLAGDAESAYSFAAPSYRAKTTFDEFRLSQMAGTYVLGVGVASVTCEAGKGECVARTRLDFRLPPQLVGGRPVNFAGLQSSYRDERWIMEEGQWWRYFDPSKRADDGPYK